MVARMAEKKIRQAHRRPVQKPLLVVFDPRRATPTDLAAIAARLRRHAAKP
jgi:hypothetical protein